MLILWKDWKQGVRKNDEVISSRHVSMSLTVAEYCRLRGKSLRRKLEFQGGSFAEGTSDGDGTPT